MKKYLSLLLLVCLAACMDTSTGGPKARQRAAVFIGIDVSGSFYNSPQYPDALEFLAYYIYGYLNGVDGRTPPKDFFVGVIGGQSVAEAKSFRPIYDFEGKSVEQIQADLKQWFTVKPDGLSDFTVFFSQVADIAHKRNMSLVPIQILVISDGVPALPGKNGKPDIGDYKKIDISPIEYLSRNVTLRLLYPSPIVASKWETEIPRARTRLWTVDSQVMSSWKSQLQAGAAPEAQAQFWKWVDDTVDYKVKAVKFQRSASRKARRP